MFLYRRYYKNVLTHLISVRITVVKGLQLKMKTKAGTKYSKFKVHDFLFKKLIAPVTTTLKNIPSITKLPKIQSKNKFSRKDWIS